MGTFKTVCRELHRFCIHCQAHIAKPLVPRANAKYRFHWCQQCKPWAVDNVKHVLFSDEFIFSVFPTSIGLTSKSLNTWTVAAQTEARGCMISDGLRCNIMAFPTVFDGFVTAKDYWIMQWHLMFQTVYTEGGAVHQFLN